MMGSILAHNIKTHDTIQTTLHVHDRETPGSLILLCTRYNNHRRVYGRTAGFSFFFGKGG